MPGKNASTGRLSFSGSAGAQANMRCDRDLFDSFNAVTDQPVLRFYTWKSPCITYGSGIKDDIFAGVDFLDGVEIAKRPTGGGCVLHDTDLAFCFIFSAGLLGGLRDSFQNLAEVFLYAFAQCLEIPDLAIAADVKKDNRQWCFCAPDNYDIVYQGVKVCGMAQRRKRDKHLFQGTISRQPAKLENFVANPDKWAIPLEKSAGLDRVSSRFISNEQVIEAIVTGFFNKISIKFIY